MATNPLDLPLPDYEVKVPIRNGFLDVKGALDSITAAGRKGQSFTLRFPAGVCMLPPSTDKTFRYDWTNWSTEDTHIALVGAGVGKTILKGAASQIILPTVIPSFAVGMWRWADFSLRDIPVHCFGFGTGPYNKQQNVAVMQRLEGRYCKGNWIMAAQEQDDPTHVCNDELWMEDLDFGCSSYEHCFYIDMRKYVFGRRLKLGTSGGMHAFKCISEVTEIEDCVFSNVDPDTKQPVTILPGESALYPNGATFYARNACMSLVSAYQGRATRIHCIKVWIDKLGDAGAAVAQRQGRWDLGGSPSSPGANPEAADPSSKEWWEAARAEGIDNPDNSYLRQSRWLWEDCIFESIKPAGRSAQINALVKQAAYPYTYSNLPRPQGPYTPVAPHWPDLWFERSKDFFYNCQRVGTDGDYRFSHLWDPATYPVDTERVLRDDYLRFGIYDEKPSWWGQPSTTPPPPVDTTPDWVPKVGFIKNIGTNVLKDLDPCPAGNCAWSGNTKLHNIYNDTGVTFIPSKGKLGCVYVKGGGHSDYAGNEVYCYDIDSQTWSRETDPDPLTYGMDSKGYHCNNDGEIWADATFTTTKQDQPGASHLNGYGVAVPPGVLGAGALGGFMTLGLPSLTFGGALGGRRAHLFDLLTKKWKRVSTNQTPTAQLAFAGAAWDTKRNRIWMIDAPSGAGRVYYFDVATGAYSAFQKGTIIAQYGTFMYAPELDRLVYMRNAPAKIPVNVINVMDPADPTKSYAVSMSGTLPPSNPFGNSNLGGGCDWCSDLPGGPGLVYYSGSGQSPNGTDLNVYIAKPDADPNVSWTWTTQTLQMVDPAVDQPSCQMYGSKPMVSSTNSAHEHRFIYAPSIKAFLWFGDVRNKVSVWRLF